MIFDFVWKFFRIFVCPLLLIWPSDLLWKSEEGEEVDLINSREQ